MDTRHRHDLEQNDLQEFLTHSGQWWDKHGMRALLVILVVVGSFAAKKWYDVYTIRAHEGDWQKLETATNPDGFRAVAKEVNNPSVAALAYLRGADAALGRAALPTASGSAASQPDQVTGEPALTPLTPETRKSFLDDAGRMYNAVIGDESAPALYKLNAKLGLAAVDEAQSDWGGARKVYQEVIDQSAGFGSIKAKAQSRLGMLEHMEVPVTFAPEVVKAKPWSILDSPGLMLPPSTQPATPSAGFTAPPTPAPSEPKDKPSSTTPATPAHTQPAP